ncbi:hypothetical protein GJAV_G00132560 [Gymnothorax javanicus]|nr:hypothetical protein GJAV_G00132560 [Gymnothorax javanicus]
MPMSVSGDFGARLLAVTFFHIGLASIQRNEGHMRTVRRLHRHYAPPHPPALGLHQPRVSVRHFRRWCELC